MVSPLLINEIHALIIIYLIFSMMTGEALPLLNRMSLYNI